VDVIGPAPLCAKLNPLCSQILHMRSTWHRSKSSLCPCQLKNLRTHFENFLIHFWRLPQYHYPVLRTQG
jgi:hypothetical protein